MKRVKNSGMLRYFFGFSFSCFCYYWKLIKKNKLLENVICDIIAWGYFKLQMFTGSHTIIFRSRTFEEINMFLQWREFFVFYLKGQSAIGQPDVVFCCQYFTFLVNLQWFEVCQHYDPVCLTRGMYAILFDEILDRKQLSLGSMYI